MKRAVLFGASGLVGSALLQLLLQDDSYTEIVSFGRRALDARHPRLTSGRSPFRSWGMPGVAAQVRCFLLSGNHDKNCRQPGSLPVG